MKENITEHIQEIKKFINNETEKIIKTTVQRKVSNIYNSLKKKIETIVIQSELYQPIVTSINTTLTVEQVDENTYSANINFNNNIELLTFLTCSGGTGKQIHPDVLEYVLKKTNNENLLVDKNFNIINFYCEPTNAYIQFIKRIENSFK